MAVRGGACGGLLFALWIATLPGSASAPHCSHGRRVGSLAQCGRASDGRPRWSSCRISALSGPSATSEILLVHDGTEVRSARCAGDYLLVQLPAARRWLRRAASTRLPVIGAWRVAHDERGSLASFADTFPIPPAPSVGRSRRCRSGISPMPLLRRTIRESMKKIPWVDIVVGSWRLPGYSSCARFGEFRLSGWARASPWGTTGWSVSGWRL